MDLYTGITIIATVQTLVLAIHMMRSDSLIMETRKGFAIFCALLIVVMVAEWGVVALDGAPENLRLLHSVVKCIEFTMAPAVIVVWAAILAKSWKLWHGIVIVAANAVIEIISLFTGWVFYMNGENIYTRGIIYWFYILSYVLSLIVLVREIIKFSSRYQHRNIAFLIGVMIVLFVGIVIQIIFSKVRITWLTGAMCVTMIYIYMVEMATQVDAVTDMLNRSSFENIIEKICYRTAIIVFDVDDFKHVNDTYGHAAGDEILEKVGSCIRKVYGQRALCFRTGGDEFCVIFKKGRLDTAPTVEYAKEQLGQPPIEGFVRSTPELEKLNRKFDEIVAKSKALDERMPEVSFGYYICEEGMNIQAATEMADTLMYKNKRRRKSSREQ